VFFYVMMLLQPFPLASVIQMLPIRQLKTDPSLP